MTKVILILLLTGCAGFKATTKAGFERMAAAHLQSCVQGNLCQYAPQCFRESEARCQEHGYDKTCGRMEAEGTCGTKVR
jgi:hypothetical protein